MTHDPPQCEPDPAGGKLPPGRISEDVEDLVATLQAGGDASPDVLVIGSGYGASIAALRLAQCGKQVWVIERGREYMGTDFPADLGDVGRHLRFERDSKGVGTATGYEEALFDLRLGNRFSCLVGNGLGGGSLINAGVMLWPPREVFALPQWPAKLRVDPAALEPFRDRVQQAFGTQTMQAGGQQGAGGGGGGSGSGSAWSLNSTDKFRRLEEFATACSRSLDPARVRVTPARTVPVTIALGKVPEAAQACIGCGNCMSGCRHGAKLSLDRTCLRAAREVNRLTRIFTRVSALWLERAVEGEAAGWRVHCVRTAERGHWSAAGGRQSGVARSHVFTIEAREVIVAAGVFGTLEILQRSRNAGLPLSDRLGHGISANGDEVGAVYRAPRRAAAVGWDESAQAHAVPPLAGAATPPRAAVGPTICGVVEFEPRGGRPVTERTIVQDGTAPALAAPVLREMLRTLAIFESHGSAARVDPAAVADDTLTHSMFLLGMGHDEAAGRFALESSAARDHERGRLSWSPEAGVGPAGPLHHRRMALGKSGPLRASAVLPGMAAGVLPGGLGGVAGTPAQGWLSVHPLGGCRMADSAADGVVDHLCRVFRPGVNGEPAAVHEGLYVMDGSVVPRSLGVNPGLTIAAIALRAADQVP